MMRRSLVQRLLRRPVGSLASTAAGPSSSPLRHARRTAADQVPERRLLYANDSFLSGTAALYMEDMYQAWLKDPSSVDASWAAIFGKETIADREQPLLESPLRVLPVDSEDPLVVKQSLVDCGRLTWMIQAFEDRGHLMAHTDPIDFEDKDPTERTPSRKFKEGVRLDLAYFGFTPADAQRVVRVGFQDSVGGMLEPNSPPITIGALHAMLVERYCGTIGYELAHIASPDVRRYVRSHIEGEGIFRKQFSKEEKMFIWDTLSSAVFFEDFFKRKYSTQKRFGCDGAESMIVGLRALLETSAQHGVEKINLGMAHRGRLNVLCHIIGKPFDVILKEFIGITGPELLPFQMQSDVKYHLGCRAELPLRGGKTMQTEMLCNPSHLEAVNPVVQGYTRAHQESLGGEEGYRRVLPIEIHGDAAFSGQGVAFETMCISESGAHGTGGTVHVVCNNQIGFTTDPKSSRSSAYCTDLGRVYECPILHVNGDSPEDVARVFEFAADFRAKFHKSIVIDLVCYRRFGHNENDDPSITQPIMYQSIRAMKDVFRRYSDTLVAERVITPQQVTAKAIAEKERYGSFHDKAAELHYATYLKQSIPPLWKHLKYSDELGQVQLLPTAVPQAQIDQVLAALRTYPDGFVPHPKLLNVLERRNEAIASGEGIDWGAAEALAFGTLLLDGHNVRVTGEDVQRGTFSQRHAVISDTAGFGEYAPLAHIAPSQGRFLVTNGPLSEYGMLGYAAGYSLYDPNDLSFWEAQYGDFANGASIVFDQFLSAGETKWNQQQAVVVSLPHGYDGKGPEHSSGRLERFLQMSSEDVETPAYSPAERAHRANWEVCYPTTPAQYFHLLRRHMKRDFRKALILFFSKQYLRAPNVSTVAELTSGGFQAVIPDAAVPGSAARRLVLCTGQIYFALAKAREQRGIRDVALVRLEELTPFPVAEVQGLLAEYASAELVWAQEEPRNMGAWAHVEPRIDHYTGGERRLRYVGRGINSSPATGYKGKHDLEQERIIDSVFRA